MRTLCAALGYIGAPRRGFRNRCLQRLGICGDSAGATLAAATCQSAIQAGSPPLVLQLLLCPILDYSRVTAVQRELSSGYLVDQATLDHDLMYYLPPGTDAVQSADLAAAAPRISPACRAHCIHTAEFDPLRDEGRNYFERLAQRGNRSVLHLPSRYDSSFLRLGSRDSLCAQGIRADRRLKFAQRWPRAWKILGRLA